MYLLPYIEYQYKMSLSEMVFPSVKPSVKPGTDGQFPDVFVEYSVSKII